MKRRAYGLGSLVVLSGIAGCDSGSGTSQVTRALTNPQIATPAPCPSTSRCGMSILDPQTQIYLTPTDNPVFGGIYEIGPTNGGIADSNGFQMNGVELSFHESIVATGDFTFARTELRPWPVDDFVTGTVNLGTGSTVFAPFTMHGTRLGFGTMNVNATEERAEPSAPNGVEQTQRTEPTPYTLFPDTLIVPVTAIVVVPNYDSGLRNTMQQLADVDYQQLLWDDVWKVEYLVSSDPGGIPSTWLGGARQRSFLQQAFDHDLRKAGAFYQPDSIWAQCGIQFRLTDVAVIDMDREVARPNDPGFLWNPTEFMHRRSCTDQCNFQTEAGGQCVNGTCSVAVGVCDNAERESLIEYIIDRARGLGARTDLFGNALPNGINSATMPIVFNFSVQNQQGRISCNGPTEQSVGVSKSREFSALSIGARDFVLAHEIGHFLGLNDILTSDGLHCVASDPDQSPGDARMLMCGIDFQMGPHIQGCQSWSDQTVFPANPLFNCLPDRNEHLAATCTAAREQAMIFALECNGDPPEFTQPPVDVTASNCGPVALGEVKAIDHLCGVPDLTVTNDAPASFGVGTTIVTWTATDAAGNTTQATQRVTIVDTTPPVMSACPGTQTAECVGGGAPISYAVPTAADDCGAASVACMPPPGSQFSAGTSQGICTATDSSGNPATCGFDAVVVDTAPPVVTVQGGGDVWAPDHQYVTKTLADCGIQIEDQCQGLVDLSAANATITCVTSDEPESGGNDRTTEDMVIVNATTALLRGERSGSGDGRVYHIHFRVTDSAGNAAQGSCRVGVLHDQGGGGAAVDSGVRFTVGSCG